MYKDIDKSINRWQQNRARETSDDQQNKLMEKVFGDSAYPPCPSCNGKGAYPVDCTNVYLHYRPDCHKCMRRESGIHYHKCLNCYGTGKRRD